jgi:hypothetical protein
MGVEASLANDIWTRTVPSIRIRIEIGEMSHAQAQPQRVY